MKKGCIGKGICFTEGFAFEKSEYHVMRQMKVDKLGIDLLTHDPVVILKDLEGKHYLPILIGPFEATAIALALEGTAVPRPPCGLPERFGFSPSANLMPGVAPAKIISCALLPHRILSGRVIPPMALAEPCRMLAVVTPPASAR